MSNTSHKGSKILHVAGSLFLMLILGLGTQQARAQVERDSLSLTPISRQFEQQLRTKTVFAQSALPTLGHFMDAFGKYFGRDTIGVGLSEQALDSLARMDSLRRYSQLTAPAFSTARDSVIEDFSTGKTMIYYYGDVSVKYENIEITANYMEYDVKANTVFATGTLDSLGVMQGKPVMKEGGNNYTMESVWYNFKSRKARINNMITQDEQGYLHGDHLKKMPDNSINIKGGKYTTCDDEHPHFYLQMTQAKITAGENGEKGQMVFGPAYVVVEDVPTPIAIPFGFVPKRPERSGGLLIPSYGEETARGFYLRELGYYLVFGDYLDLSLTTDIYTKGSWAVRGTSRYKVKYKFSGNLNVNYSVNATGEKGSSDFNKSSDFSIKWSHQQDPKKRPGTTFSASVNFSTPTNNRYNSTSINEALQNQTSSSISYAKTLKGTPFNFSVNLLHSQNSRDSSYSMTLPNFTFTMSRINPFERKERVGKKRFYEEINISYNAAFQNKINFKISQLGKDEMWDDFKTGMQHNFTIGLPSFTLLKYLNFTPSVTYGMNWHFQSQTRTYDAEADKVVTTTSKPFSEFKVTQNYSAGLSASTRIYGMFNFRGKKLKAIRHMITPSISASFRPEMGTEANGYTKLIYTDSKGVEKVVEYNRYANSLYAAPAKGKTASLSFSLGNNLEAKVASQDTTLGPTKKIKLIDNLSLSGSYNFLADSMKLSNISVSLSTTIFEKMGLNASMNLDPYAVNQMGQRINKFQISQNGAPVRLTSANFSTSYSFSGEGKSVKNNAYQMVYENPVTGERVPGGWVYYMDPEVPWSLNLNYNFSYNRSYQYANETLHTNHNFTQTLGISAQVRITKDLNVNINTGLDLMKMKLTTTQLSATYDMHCFQMSFSWVPNGQWESWSFRIAAKAAALADLLQYKKSSSYWDN